ncbi:CreA family protein [Paracoccus benzoatiresistens]|uniref:CreA family protein n=1 Tax=Paracoccus benzoatiresistens TaxID=2997341 RepID=A0ABT4J9M9_9RHOB|nr:CreA family protein [Paracoccus sp. EF6]MCZ0963038.1 CreA family protein [Paracoccus sp. EF6]
MRMIAAALLMLPALVPVQSQAEEIAQVGVDWVGNDIVIEAIRDPDVGGVTCHLAYFERSVLDRLSQGNWFEDPSNSAIQCSRTGPVDVSTLRPGAPEDVFSEGRSLLFKSLRVKRIYDAENRVLVYLAHASELSEGSAKMSMSTVPLPVEEAGARPTD